MRSGLIWFTWIFIHLFKEEIKPNYQQSILQKMERMFSNHFMQEASIDFETKLNKDKYKENTTEILLGLCGSPDWDPPRGLHDLECTVFIPIPKKGELPSNVQTSPHNCTHFRCQPKRSFSEIHQKLEVQPYVNGQSCWCTTWIQKAEEQRSNCQHLWDHRQAKGILGKHLPSLLH